MREQPFVFLDGPKIGNDLSQLLDYHEDKPSKVSYSREQGQLPRPEVNSGRECLGVLRSDDGFAFALLMRKVRSGQ